MAGFESLPSLPQAMLGENVLQTCRISDIGFHEGDQSGVILSTTNLEGDGHEMLCRHDLRGLTFVVVRGSLLDGLSNLRHLGGQELHRWEDLSSNLPRQASLF